MRTPLVRALEPRFVLNASAELNVLGQLVVSGSVQDDAVQLQVNPTGDLQLSDDGAPIAIMNHPGGPGAEKEPLNPAAITAGQIIFTLLEGDDILDLQLPRGLDVTVNDSLGQDGEDLTMVRFVPGGTTGTIDVTSETIDLGDDLFIAETGGAELLFKGDVLFGPVGFPSQLDIGAGSLTVEGRLSLADEVSIIGNEGSINLTDAVLSARAPGTNLFVSLLNQPGADVQFGKIDGSRGFFVHDITVASAGTTSVVSSSVTLLGELSIRNVGESVHLQAEISTGGSIDVSSMGLLSVNGVLRTSDATAAIRLAGSGVSLVDADIITSGGDVTVRGPVEVDGDVFIDSGNAQSVASAGQVEFFDVIQSNDESGDILRIEALGGDNDGSVRLGKPVGSSTASPTLLDLNRLEIQAARIEVDSLGISGGDIRLSAESIRLMGSEIRTRTSGDILVGGDLLLPAGIGTVSAANRAQFTSSIIGQSGATDLQVFAGMDALFDGLVTGVRNLNVVAGGRADFQGTVTLFGDFAVSADRILVAANVDTKAGAPDGDVRLNGRASVTVTGAQIDVGRGTINVNGGGGLIDVGGGALLSTSIGDAVTLRHANRVILGGVQADNGNLTTGIGGDIAGNVSQFVGTSVNIDRFTAETAGSIDLSSTANQIRSVDRIRSRGVVTLRDSTADLDVADVDTQGSDIAITAAGSILLAQTAITATHAHATLAAGGGIFDRDGTPQTNIDSDTVQLTATTPGIGVRANPLDVNATGSLSASTADTGGDITIANRDGAILVGNINATTGEVFLSALRIDDAQMDFNGPVIDVTAVNLEMLAINGIGVSSVLELTLDSGLTANTTTGGIDLQITARGALTVSASAMVSGNVNLVHRGFGQSQPLILRTLETGNGTVTVTSGPGAEVELGGTITAVDVVSNGNIALTANGAQSDILVGSIAALNDFDVVLVADDDILDTDRADANRVVADDLRLLSRNRDSMNPITGAGEGIDLSTRVNDLQAIVAGAARGDLRIDEVDDIRLASSDVPQDEIVQTGNGNIVINAGGNITIVDSGGSDGDDRKADPEIEARGQNGRVRIISDGLIEFQDNVQIHAHEIDDQIEINFPTRAPSRNFIDASGLNTSDLSPDHRSVFLQSDRIIFGDGIEIATGVEQDVGVARLFAPRPVVEIDPTDPDIPVVVVINAAAQPAFFQSIDTNILEQAVVNDAVGVLTLDIGQTGETGLTLDIDWGAPTRRFQQINGLSADQSIFVGIDATGNPLAPEAGTTGESVVEIEHFYTQDDITESRLNSRDAATAPLEVRFAIRQHPSILVVARSVQQQLSDEIVPGSVVSSTDIIDSQDIPESEGLNNGRALFIIPSLSIPVAFFPIRDVIPEFETPEFAVKTESTVPLVQNVLETLEASVSSTVSREEYFQIRIISPDPDGEELAEPQRLPDSILEGDKIKQLFSQLPDGQYEIEYVLGDGNERSILRVDVRDGKITTPGDELEEGLLQLKRISGEAFDDIESTQEPVDLQTSANTDQVQQPAAAERDETTAKFDKGADPLVVQSKNVTFESADSPEAFSLALSPVALAALRRRIGRRKSSQFSVAARRISRRIAAVPGKLTRDN